jgi:hypothetical protein
MNAMRTSKLPRCFLLALTVIAALNELTWSTSAQGSGTDTVPTVPLVNIRASVPETSEPVCDPDLCDAPLPAPGVLVVSRAGDLSRELMVWLRYRGTASNSIDYHTLPASVLFRPGISNIELFVEATHDLLPEGDETVLAELVQAAGLPGYDIVGPLPARVVIHDNDLPLVPVVGIRAAVAETREPLCPPATCLAPEPVPGVFVVTRRGGDLAHELSVWVRYAGTAVNGTDYATLPEWIQFPAGAESVELQVRALFDGLSEGDETVLAELQPDPSLGPIERYRIDPAQAAARAVIHDNEPPAEPVVRIEATSPIAEESSYPYRRLAFRGRFTISRTGPTNNPLPVFVHYGGTATRGVDYPFLPWLVSIPAGSNRVEIEVVPNMDDVPEPIETVVATLSECPPLTDPPLGIPCYLVNIDPARSSAQVFIRDDGITTATLEITAPKNGEEFSEGTPIRIAATALDLEGAITHVDFFDGDRKIGESTILFFREPDPGTPIYHDFEWHDALAGPHVLTARAVNTAGNAVTSAPASIHVGGGLPVVSIEATVAETTEPSPTTRVRPGVFTLRRTGDTSRALRVWTHYGGTATSGVDYVAPSPVVEFPAGAASVEVLIGPLDDELFEGDETVIGQLTPSPLAVVPEYRIDPVHNQARIIIHDNDAPDRPLVSIRATQPFTAEPCPVCLVAPGVFTLSRTGGTDAPLAVWYLLGGTALNGVDYARLSGQAIIPAGRESVEILVLPVLDSAREGEETVVAQLIIPPVGALIDPYRIDPEHHTATVIIRDSLITPPGPPIVSIRATDPFAREGGGGNADLNTATFVVSRTGETNDSLGVLLSSGGTAVNSEDYSAIPDYVTIPAGRRSARIVIRPIDDNLKEKIETVVIELHNPPVPAVIPPIPPTYMVGWPGRAAAIIVDNDVPRPPCLRLPDGLFNLCLPVDVYRCFRVERTRDFKEWTPICTVPADDGIAHYVDPDAPDSPHRFYRLVPAAWEPEE